MLSDLLSVRVTYCIWHYRRVNIEFRLSTFTKVSEASSVKSNKSSSAEKSESVWTDPPEGVEISGAKCRQRGKKTWQGPHVKVGLDSFAYVVFSHLINVNGRIKITGHVNVRCVPLVRPAVWQFETKDELNEKISLTVNRRLHFVLMGSHSLDDPSCTLIHFPQVCVRSCNQITRFGLTSVQYVFCGPRTPRCIHYVTHGYRVGVLWLQPPLNPLWANKHTRPVYELCGGAGIGGQTDPVTVTLQLSLVCNIKTGVWNDRLLPPAAPSALLCSAA